MWVEAHRHQAPINLHALHHSLKPHCAPQLFSQCWVLHADAVVVPVPHRVVRCVCSGHQSHLVLLPCPALLVLVLSSATLHTCACQSNCIPERFPKGRPSTALMLKAAGLCCIDDLLGFRYTQNTGHQQHVVIHFLGLELLW